MYWVRDTHVSARGLLVDLLGIAIAARHIVWSKLADTTMYDAAALCGNFEASFQPFISMWHIVYLIILIWRIGLACVNSSSATQQAAVRAIMILHRLVSPTYSHQIRLNNSCVQYHPDIISHMSAWVSRVILKLRSLIRLSLCILHACDYTRYRKVRVWVLTLIRRNYTLAYWHRVRVNTYTQLVLIRVCYVTPREMRACK